MLAPVKYSPDLIRVLNLPEKSNGGVDLSPIYKPDGQYKLWSHQEEALQAAYEAGGLFAPIAVGGGKTLICSLLPTVLNSKKAVILTKASMTEEGVMMMAEYSQHFHISSEVHWISYSTLSSPKFGTVLKDIGPDLIIADEAHCLKSAKAARTKRFLRYMRNNPDVKFCALSGTITKRSIQDFAHLAALALRHGSFCPLTYVNMREWAEALDVSFKPRPEGALSLLKDNPKQDVREGFQSRMRKTAGVVASVEMSSNVDLQIHCAELGIGANISQDIETIEETWIHPAGHEMWDALEVTRAIRDMKLGGYHTWARRPPQLWLEARNEFGKEMRRYLTRAAREGRDSPKLVTDAIKEGRIKGIVAESYRAWEVAQTRYGDDFPRIWVQKHWSLIDKCAQFLDKPRILWTESVGFGIKLAKRLNLQYYGAQNLGILDEVGDRPIVASIRAHGTGRNLQMFNDSIVVAALPTGLVWEQLLGRLHRAGQQKTVHYTYLDRFKLEVKNARHDALYIEQLTGNKQKLNHARYL